MPAGGYAYVPEHIAFGVLGIVAQSVPQKRDRLAAGILKFYYVVIVPVRRFIRGPVPAHYLAYYYVSLWQRGACHELVISRIVVRVTRRRVAVLLPFAGAVNRARHG